MSHDHAVRGHRTLALPRASKTFAQGRRCLHDGCTTRLSVYNRREKCFAHAEMKVPRLRGRKSAA